MKYILHVILWAGVALCIMHCSSPSDLAGGDTSQTGNSRVLGKVVDTSGIPLSGVRVTLVPTDYNPADFGSPVLLNDTSDVNGDYEVTKIRAGAYNLQGIDSANFKRVLIRNVVVAAATESLVVPTDTLRNPGSLIVPYSDTNESQLYIQGTTLIQSPQPILAMPGFVLFDSLFTGTIPPVFVIKAGETGTGNQLGGNTLSIFEGDAIALSVLPSPWSYTTFGQQAVVGGAAYSNGTFVLTGSGPDTGKTFDDLLFVERLMTGNVGLVARLMSIEDSDPSALAGLMFRDSLTSTSRFFRIECTATGSAVVSYRLNNNDTIITIQQISNGSYPRWFRLKRSENDYEGAVSPDGVQWTLIASFNMTLAQDIHVGMYVTSRNNAALCTAVFEGVSPTN